MPSEMKRLRELEEENGFLKRALFAQMVGAWRVSIRRAYGLMKIAARSYRYRSRRLGQAALDTRIKEICVTQVVYGYRRIHFVLRREGRAINVKHVRRIYSGLGLLLRNSEAGGCQRTGTIRPPNAAA